MPNFEVFTQRIAPSAGIALVTIQKRGAISLNKTAFVALGEPNAVELLYDRTERIIGLRSAQPEAEHAYPVRSAAGGHSPFVVSAIAFTKFYNIDTDRTLRWHASFTDGVLCVELNSVAIPVTSSRSIQRASSGH
ncbi:MAG: hypothetical protein M3Y77_10960 [Actinomycetota bacterium]|nr:hypothetical protein [Actinomycetota bacterium]MDQ2956450.1 hypothetical protein [Actinomycetota bacterium]